MTRPLIITRIASRLEQMFKNHIDMSDCDRRPEQQEGIFLSRALAALCIKTLANTNDDVAANAVTDGFQDYGIDAIYFDAVGDSLYLVQSKWSNTGTKLPDQKEIAEFVDGVAKLLIPDLDGCNNKISKKEGEIRSALAAERHITLVLVTAHTADNMLPGHIRAKVDDYVDGMNTAIVMARAEHFDQKRVYQAITSESSSPKIDITVYLSEWGMIDRPYLAFYGRVDSREIAKWWRGNGQHLCFRNLRYFRGKTDVNEALAETLIQDPSDFWYFNNGITIICDSIVPSLSGGHTRAVGLFNCKGVSIVNGAQTVGMIGTSTPISEKDGGVASDEPTSWVQVRIVSLEKTPPDFDARITRATNTQNAIGPIDFAALDPVQHRLASDFALDRRRYTFKSGEPNPQGDDGCSLEEATPALACAYKEVDLAVMAKRHISGLFADITKPPYTNIFNDKLTSHAVWKAVQIKRTVDQNLRILRDTKAPRADGVGVHLNYLILYLVFQDPQIRQYRREEIKAETLVPLVKDVCADKFSKLCEYMRLHHADEYLAALSKHTQKCRAVVENLSNPVDPDVPPDPQPYLFGQEKL